MWRLSSVSVRVGRVVARIVEYGSNVICIGMWQGFIWTWPSFGGAQCRGAPYGRARPRTAWIIFAGRMNVPWEIKSASLEQYLPPWTVTRKVWSDSLTAQHSGGPLFSDVHLSLVHHYRIHK